MKDHLGQQLEHGNVVVLEKYTGYKGICLGVIIGFTPQKVKVYQVDSIEIAKNFDQSDLIQKEDWLIKRNTRYKQSELLIKINVDTMNDIN
jgi:hypothetical protein